jgi:hypothetical protein
MTKFEDGFTQVMVLIILILGVFIGTYLVTQQTQLFSQAAEFKDYIGATRCSDDNQCKPGYYCQEKKCDTDRECNKNPKTAVCAIKLQLCGGVCIPGARKVATASAMPNPATNAATLKPSPTASSSTGYNPKPRTSGQICAQVITRACQKNNPTLCKVYGSPCDVPDGMVISK